MNNERCSFESSIELKHFSIVLQKLFLRIDFSSSQLLLKVFFHLSIFFWNPLVVDCGSPQVITIRDWWTLRLPNLLVKFSSIVIAIIEENRSPINFWNLAKSKIVGSHKFPIILDILFSFEKFTLRNSRVLFFFLVNRNRIVLDVEKYLHLSVPRVF